MNRSLRLTLIMAILGFILGLGFLIPLPSVETREPASVEPANTAIAFLEPKGEKVHSEERPSESVESDSRPDVVFDVHTISRSPFAKGIEAYVVARFSHWNSNEVSEFAYCHNYDFKRQRANVKLKRYAYGPNGFLCYTITLEALAEGYALIDTPFGEMLTIRSKPGFDPSRGGKISVIYAYKVAKIGRHDYRTFDIGLSVASRAVRVTGPRGEFFNWLDLRMTEDVLMLPNGVNQFELFLSGRKVTAYSGQNFPKTPRP